ncbi:hypothetical protein B0E38_01820 [Streptomyces sp. 111WW2]|uniref:hypothetical protein n=1 Tax=Streptomyces sp. 111WW2 TaxID=1945515 RepID=UPI000D0C783A|nr:hypothetical protein [Streptomyces sp. 111WW2]PSK57975.1 hypothetical protein B0E38_01820 [Streptomyces sp. 111WW2]
MPPDRCPDHIERLDLCPQCQGLAVTRMKRLDGVTDVSMDGPAGPLVLKGPATVYMGPVEPCPNPPAPEAGAHE